MAKTNATGKFGKYTLLEKLAVGGMAEIFLGQQAGLEGFEKTIVIKRIRPHLSDQKNFVQMFLHEGRLAAQLNHPNIVTIYDLGKISANYFIAMEYVFGRDMRQIFPRSQELEIPFPMEYALKIASSVCEGLYYAHNKTDAEGKSLTIVHRDISPENIMVSFDGNVKITDFGIAKAHTQLEHTKAGEIKGKLCYMSPEQCRAELLDHRSDIFSLGVVLYEWMTGYKIFTGDNEMQILKSVMEGKIYPPSYFKADIPEAVEHIIMKALARDKRQRYKNAWDMQYDIDSFLSQHIFTPSNLHLANFIRQLFNQEMERDKKRIKGKISKLKISATQQFSSGGYTELKDSETGKNISDDIEIIEDAEEIVESQVKALNREAHLNQELPLKFSEMEYDNLIQIASRNNIEVEDMLRDIVTSFTKYY